MGSHGHLGEFEFSVLLAVMHRRGDAYGVTIADELKRRTDRTPSRGALYITLKRLDEKGYLTSHLGRPRQERGGHRRRYYTPTPQGISAAGVTARAMQGMWAGLEAELEEA